MNAFFKVALPLVLLAISFTSESWAESPNTQVKATVKLERLQGILSPTLEPGTMNRAFKPKSWMFLEARMSILAAPEPPTGYLDAITVRFYVAAKNREGKGNLLMTKEIKYVNIPVQDEVYICVLMSPSSIRRLTGSDTIGSSTFGLYGVEIVYKDKVVAADSSRMQPGWWAKPSASLVPTGSYPLLNKNETPFAMFWYDRYPEIAPDIKNEKASTPEGLAPVSGADFDKKQ